MALNVLFIGMSRIYASQLACSAASPIRLGWGLLLLLALQQPVAATDLHEIHQLRDTGFLGLAIRTLDRFQPPVDKDADGWLRWERERFGLYERGGQPDQLIDRIARYRDQLPDRHARTLMFHGVSAYLAMGDGKGARELLSDLLLGHKGELDRSQEAFARRLLVTAYLYEKQPRKALVALQYLLDRFTDQAGVGPGPLDWRQLQAQVYLLNGDLKQAGKLVAGDDGNDYPLRLLIHLRSGRLSPRQVIAACRKQLAVKAGSEGEYYAVLAEAAGRLGEGVTAVDALEQAQLFSVQTSVGIYRASPASLWQAYRQMRPELARSLGIAENSSDQQWLKRAEDLARDNASRRRKARSQGNSPDLVRYVYAMLAAADPGGTYQDLAHGRLAMALLEQDNGYRLLTQLYLDKSSFPSVTAIPEGVRHQLIAEAVRRADTPLASQLMRGLEQAPPGVARLDWQLRQARVHVMAGISQQAMEVILGLIRDVHRYDSDQLDRLVQVLFDLQAIGEHRVVIPMLEAIYAQIKDVQRRRELLYWIADSMRELKEYDEAARYYLKSATLVDSEAMDMWARSARFQAAEMLTLAGLPGDASKIYQQLLAVTKDPGQRKHLQRNIQQLAYRQR